MRIRRTVPPAEVHGLPLDSCDMFILSRVEQALSLVELAELAPCDLEEAMARVRALVELGVLDLFEDEEAELHEEERARRASRLSVTGQPSDAPRGTFTEAEAQRVADAETERTLLAAIPLERVHRPKDV